MGMNPTKLLRASVVQEGRFVKAYADGRDVTKLIPQAIRLQARDAGLDIEQVDTDDWRLVAKDAPVTITEPAEAELAFAHTATDDTVNFIHRKAVSLIPKDFIISPLKWKYLVRSVMRGNNIKLVGPTGTGKTSAYKHVAAALGRPTFYFNLGATQDPRATLIGNVHFSKESGTYFSESMFVKAIQVENSVILLDELSRAHPEAWNILMTVLDPGQRYLRLDEQVDSPIIKVASGVSFIATANVGTEYTSTRRLDRAIEDRFITIEMDSLNTDQEYNLLKMRCPKLTDKQAQAIAEIANATRNEVKSANPKLTTSLSTRSTLEIGSLLEDGFALQEAAEVSIYPFFSEDGGVDSERTYIKQIVQKYCVDELLNKELFNIEDATTNPF